jgi:hypothetical protein
MEFCFIDFGREREASKTLPEPARFAIRFSHQIPAMLGRFLGCDNAAYLGIDAESGLTAPILLCSARRPTLIHRDLQLFCYY